MTPKIHTSAEKPLVCRPDAGLWVLVVILMAIGLILPFIPTDRSSPNPQEEAIGMAVFCALFCVPALCTAFYLLRVRIVADDNGLIFQGIWRRTQLSWRQIEDYEWRIPSPSQSKSGLPIAYLRLGGKWRSLSRIYKPYDELLERVVREAKWSKANEWQQNDLRDDGDWPKTFVYKDVSGWRIIGKYLLISFAFLGANCLKLVTGDWSMVVTNIALTWSYLSFWERVGFAALPFIICGSVPLIILAEYPAVKTRRRYLDQKLIASHEGLSYWKSGTEIFARWEEIESYYLETLSGHFQPTLCVVKTSCGRVEFVSGISNTKTLQALIQTRAKNVTTKSWLHKNGVDEDVLGGEASMWRGNCVGVGEKIYHYRTRTARALLMFVGFMWLGFCSPLIIGHYGSDRMPSTGDTIFFSLCTLFGGGATFLGLRGFFSSYLQCEARGLRQHSIWGERFLPWNEVEKFAFNGYYCVVSGRKNKIRFGPVANMNGLCGEIERRSGVERKRNENAV